MNSSRSPIRVLVADDQDLVRMGLLTLLRAEPGLEPVADVADGLAAVAEAKATRPDVVLMDIRMPGIDGLEATRRIVADPDLAETKVLVLTTFELDEYVFEALRIGASGFLVKSTKPAQLVAAIEEVHEGGTLLSPSVTRTVVSEFVSMRPGSTTPHPDIDTLTPREVEVLRLVAQGLSNDEIAAQLVMSPATARTHVSRVITKLGARDRAQLVVFAYQSGLA